ncbi:aminodeoxychorismate synthase component I [Stakelama sediminis]|uniref:Probable branched-chain-amino-acid aminotransferase n=1 Tax=Stakelama sediminis TaxID=463200 RepID=A0A840YXM3_9SPHN|nr:aminodeoxychorismate synthase component I [Stakelama sediminis]MBB5718276.1 para-aminobenzoate synthetase/4-amino-4-deoxychorismate lyase [Stakelama sediminis]
MTRLDDANPFVLLDDARPGGAPARLYTDPVELVEAWSADAVPACLDRIRAAARDGLHAAGFLGYGAGAAFEPIMPTEGDGETPLLWFGLFRSWEELTPKEVEALLPDPTGAWIGRPQPDIDFAAYADHAETVAGHIRDGDIYQANLTFQATVPAEGHVLAVYAALRRRARAGYGAAVWTGQNWLLSFSPELFFALEGGRLRVRPMKGTAPRGTTPEEDKALVEALRSDPKQRAENLMIVDLMRNDLSRIARPGSVAVPEKFGIETYPTVHQMVSGVTAELAPGKDAVDVLGALFPCGSITGAPKIRAMQVIAEVEQGVPRGPYTGAIGRIDADGDAMFNVAIRTLWSGEGGRFRIGLGSGYVADSEPRREWEECLAKGAFLNAGQRPFDLIETMAFDPRTGITLLERHLARMKESAARFGFSFDRHAARNELQAATFRLRAPSRVRLLLSPSGAVAIGIDPMPVPPDEPVLVAIRPLPVDSNDFRLRHKTTDRAFYDDARRASGAFEIVFTTPDGALTEGSFTSIFVPQGDRLATPPIRSALPGVLRAELLESGRAFEKTLKADDLTQEFYIGNALRGLIRARLVAESPARG